MQQPGWRLRADHAEWHRAARKIVLAGGLRNGDLGRMVGLDLPMAPQRGQILVLERTRRLLDTPMVTLRQNDEGSWLVGDSQEEAGYAEQVTTLPVLATLADRAVRTLPALRDVRGARLVRAAACAPRTASRSTNNRQRIRARSSSPATAA